METYQYLILGGGVAGATAAETIRLKKPDARVAVVNDEPYALYSRVMLSKPNFFLGKIPFDQVWMKGEKWYADNRIEFLGGKTAAGLDPAAKILRLSDGTEVGYEKLLLATGVAVRKWEVPGADKKGVHYLRTLDDGKKIMEGIKTAKRALTIGGGFISFEMSDLLRLAGLETSLILRDNYFWEPFLDEPSGRMIEAALARGGVKIFYKAEVAEVKGGESVTGVVLKDGTEIPCDMIICGIGTRSEMDWLRSSGIKTNRGILADEFLKTSLPDVWTAGDVAEYNDLLLRETVQMGNWVSAREQGRIAALGMLGAPEPFRFVSFYTTSGLGVSIAFTGDTRPLPGRTIIARGSPEINSYGRIFLADNRVVGASFINRIAEMGTVAKLIENGRDCAGHENELTDPAFDLKKLLQVPAAAAIGEASEVKII